MIFGKCTYWKRRHYLPIQNVLNGPEPAGAVVWPRISDVGYEVLEAGRVLGESFRQREPHLKSRVTRF